jgi:hypothetical protein
MKSRYILIVIVIVIASFSFKSRFSKSTEIKRTGNKIFIKSNKHQITASVMGHQRTESFLVFGGSRDSDLDFTTALSVIPLYTADRLAKRYGSFFRCASPGAAEAKRSIKNLFLYPANNDIERSIKQINKLTVKGKDPVIKIKYVELVITDHRFQRFGQEIKFEYRDNFISCLVEDVQLIQEDKRF